MWNTCTRDERAFATGCLQAGGSCSIIYQYSVCVVHWKVQHRISVGNVCTLYKLRWCGSKADVYFQQFCFLALEMLSPTFVEVLSPHKPCIWCTTVITIAKATGRREHEHFASVY